MDNKDKRVEICFWCGRPKDSSIDPEKLNAKNTVIPDYTPCDKCIEEFDGGIHVIGVSTDPIVENMPPISKDDKLTLYPTGSMFVGADSFIKDMLLEDNEKEEDNELLQNVLKERVLMIPNELCESIIEEIRRTKGENSDEKDI